MKTTRRSFLATIGSLAAAMAFPALPVLRRTRLLSETNVRDFGAKGDGITDDTAAIQDAIRHTAPGGFTRIPDGQYLVCGLVLGPRQVLGGDGIGKTMLVTRTDFAGPNFTVRDDKSSISNMTVFGNGKNSLFRRDMAC